eukprot:8185840-Karenia_brevis.AAC.1
MGCTSAVVIEPTHGTRAQNTKAERLVGPKLDMSIPNLAVLAATLAKMTTMQALRMLKSILKGLQ